jgi:hypothetical protein
MELTEHPNGTHAPALRQARDLACTHNADNTSFILNSIHVDAPGNYNPVLEQSQEVCRQVAGTTIIIPLQPETKSPASPISPTPPEDFAQIHFTSADKGEPTHIHNWDDEDNRMGLG